MRHALVLVLAAICFASSMPLSAAEFTLGDAVEHPAVGDGSAGVAVGKTHFIDACDEDNILRLYPRGSTDEPKKLLNVGPLLGLTDLKDNGKPRECDLEGAARLKGGASGGSDLIFWLGSHSRNSSGEEKLNRHVLFATKRSGDGDATQLTLEGAPCKTLLTTMLADDRLKDFALKEASTRAAEAEGGLNIEALCADGDRLLIGFRNPLPKVTSPTQGSKPLPEGGALIVPLLNPRDVIQNKEPVLGDSIVLDLGGLGIRDMTRWRGQFLIVAGGPADRVNGEPAPKLFRWSGDPKDAPVDMKITLDDLNPEGTVVYGEGADEELQLLSDDGKEPPFRSVEVKVTAP